MILKEMQMIDVDGDILLFFYVQKYMKKIKLGSK